jgi:hypothetical protein
VPRHDAAESEGGTCLASTALTGGFASAFETLLGDDAFAGAAEEPGRAAIALAATMKIMSRTVRAVLTGKRVVGFASCVFWKALLGDWRGSADVRGSIRKFSPWVYREGLTGAEV